MLIEMVMASVMWLNTFLSSDGNLLEVVDTGGWCASKLGMGPEYPGLDDSAEYASWSVLHWISSLD
jgi:hypothetical protein